MISTKKFATPSAHPVLSVECFHPKPCWAPLEHGLSTGQAACRARKLDAPGMAPCSGQGRRHVQLTAAAGNWVVQSARGSARVQYAAVSGARDTPM
jgi:hypothetical protein